MGDRSKELRVAVSQLSNDTNNAALERFYSIVLQDFIAVRDSLETMRQEKDEKSDLHVVTDMEISERLRAINEWLQVSEGSVKSGHLKLYTSSGEFRRLNQKLSIELQSLINMVRGESAQSFTTLRKELSRLQERIDNFQEMASESQIVVKGETIIFNKHGELSECPERLREHRVRPWTSEERIDKIPSLENRMFVAFESDILIFTTPDGKPTTVKSIDDKDLLVKVQLQDSAPVDDRKWSAKIHDGQQWTSVDAYVQDGYAMFKTNAVESFFLISTPKEKEFIVPPTGCQYVHRADERVQIDFPKGAVLEAQHFKVQVIPVKREEMKTKRKLYPNQYSFLALSKGVHVEGKLNEAVNLQLPLEVIDDEMDDADIEYVYFHIRGENVEIVKEKRIVRQGETISTSVNSFSTVCVCAVRRGSRNSISTKETLIGLGILHHCKILTLFHKSSERYVKIWCELVKREDAENVAKERLQSEEGLAKVDQESKDIFIREEERIRVDIKGNAEVNKKLVSMTSLLMTFIPVADRNQIYIPVDKGTSGHYTTITYTTEKFGRGTLHVASFDPWSKPKTTLKRLPSVEPSPTSGGTKNLPRASANVPANVPSTEPSAVSSPAKDKAIPPCTPSNLSKKPETKSSSAATTVRDSDEYRATVATDSSHDSDHEKSSDFVRTDQAFLDFFVTYDLEDMKPTFVREKFDRMEALKMVTEEDLREMNFKAGERKAFLAAMEKFKNESEPKQ